jgi:ArsR family transcriptional regulator
MRKLVKVFKAVSDPNRVRILKMLELRPLCVCEITEVLRLANSTVSKHLALLRDAELIIDEKNGRWVHYRLNNPTDESYVNELLPLLTTWLHHDETIRRDAEKASSVDAATLCGT